eukprot:281503-Rhodomonas_salina.3
MKRAKRIGSRWHHHRFFRVAHHDARCFAHQNARRADGTMRCVSVAHRRVREHAHACIVPARDSLVAPRCHLRTSRFTARDSTGHYHTLHRQKGLYDASTAHRIA